MFIRKFLKSNANLNNEIIKATWHIFKCAFFSYLSFPVKNELWQECTVNRKFNLNTRDYLPLFHLFFLCILTFSCRAMITNNSIMLSHELQKQNLIGAYSLSKLKKVQSAKCTRISCKNYVSFNNLSYY